MGNGEKRVQEGGGEGTREEMERVREGEGREGREERE